MKYRNDQGEKFVRAVAPVVMACVGLQAVPAHADDNGSATPFTLGTIVVTKGTQEVGHVGDDQVASHITQDDMRQFNRDNVGDALDLLSGVTVSNNSRNEKTIAIRGFDSRQVPLFIDGIPVYVPYDGYIDFNRFTTADLAAIQVAKGFSSVAYGPNTLGGAINLISRKPVKKLEGDASAGFGSSRERQVAANVGTNQGTWYLQTGAAYIDSDGFPLSDHFRATTTEDGGQRDNAYRTDSKASIKVGLTPNAKDEYALSYYRQDGEKGQPPSTDASKARYWQWPYWNKESLYFVSNTALGGSESLKARIYKDKYDNEVDSFTDNTYSKPKISGPGSVGTGESIYEDNTNGASIELESVRLHANTVRLVDHIKKDEHKEFDANGTLDAHYEDTLASLGLEDSIQIGDNQVLALGVSRDELQPDTFFSTSNAYTLPGDSHANNAQAGYFYDASYQARYYATIARKSRLPTLKDRYSQRLGTYIENPDLQPEEAINYEIGFQGTPWKGGEFDAAIFRSDITDKIQSVANVAGTKSQMQNIGEVRSQGIELGMKHRASNGLEAAFNYTFDLLDNQSDPNQKVTDIPKHKLIGSLIAHPLDRLECSVLGEYNSRRWASNTLTLGGFTTYNVKAAYHATPQAQLEAGIDNLTDKNYSLADGFPNPGRTWFVGADYKF